MCGAAGHISVSIISSLGLWGFTRINIEYGARDIVGLVLEVGPYLRRGMKTDCVLEWASLACPYLGLCQRLTDESTGEP